MKRHADLRAMDRSTARGFPVCSPMDLKKFLFPAILAASAVLRLFRLDGQGLWFDETYTAFVAGQTPEQMMRYLLTDGVHPPLYYGWMAVWVRIFGESAWSLRIPSVLFGVLSVGLIYLLTRKIAGEAAAVLSAFLLGLSPFMVWYSQDARMYSMECLAALAAVYGFWMFLSRPGKGTFMGMVLSHAFLYGVHYFGVFLFMAEALFLVLYWRKYLGRVIPFLAAQGIACAPLCYWGYLLLQRESGSFGIGWIPKPVWADPLLTVVNFFSANAGAWNVPAVVTGLVLLILFTAAAGGKKHAEAAGFAVFWLAVPIGMAWILSQQIPIYIDRYFLLCVPAAVLLASLGAVSLGRRKGAVLTILLTCAMAPGLWGVFRPTEVYHKEDWKAVAEYLKQTMQSGDLLLLRVYQTAVPLNYYGVLDGDWQAVETNRIVELPEITPEMGRCFLVDWLPSQAAHSFGTPFSDEAEESNPLVREWMDANLRLREVEWRFHGVVVFVLEPVRP